MLRWQRCVRACNRRMIFYYPGAEKQEFGCGFDFFLPPEMCLNGCAGDGCLRNQQKLSCLAGAESLVLPGGSKAGMNVHAGKVKGFSARREAGTPWSDSTSRAQGPPAPLRGQEMQHQSAANQGLTFPGGPSHPSRQRGRGFALREPPGTVTTPKSHLLHRWEQRDNFCPLMVIFFP